MLVGTIDSNPKAGTIKMPRQCRIEFPGLLYHAIVRGIEGRKIFIDEKDYKELLRRIVMVKEDSRIFAWALMPNHAHILIMSGEKPLSKIMSQMLTGYALYFNTRHKRAGHLFQNRYKAIVCDEDRYFKMLVRYIHLNPLKAGLVGDLNELSKFKWCGHPTILGESCNSWQEVDGLLSHFGDNKHQSVNEYMRYMEDGATDATGRNLSGGGLIRSLGGIGEAVCDRKAGIREAYDSRLLGTGEFVTQILIDHERKEREALEIKKKFGWENLQGNVCRRFGVNMADMRNSTRGRTIARAREACIYFGITRLGMNGEELGEKLDRDQKQHQQSLLSCAKLGSWR